MFKNIAISIILGTLSFALSTPPVLAHANLFGFDDIKKARKKARLEARRAAATGRKTTVKIPDIPLEAERFPGKGHRVGGNPNVNRLLGIDAKTGQYYATLQKDLCKPLNSGKTIVEVLQHHSLTTPRAPLPKSDLRRIKRAKAKAFQTYKKHLEEKRRALQKERFHHQASINPHYESVKGKSENPIEAYRRFNSLKSAPQLKTRLPILGKHSFKVQNEKTH